jgi:hypothetical protein
MPPRLAAIYPAPRAAVPPPPIFTLRTVALPAAASVGAVLSWLGQRHDVAAALAAAASVLAMQLIAPWIRRRSLAMAGVAAEVLFAAPFLLFFLPYLVWTVVTPPPLAWSWSGAGAAVVVGVAVHLSDWRRVRLGFDRGLLELMPPLRSSTAALRGYQILAAAIGQELFYRGVILVLLGPTLGWWAVPASATLFVLEHLGNRWASAVFDPFYVARISVLSAVLSTISYATGSVWAALAGHLAYNLFPVAQLAWHRHVNPHQSVAAV